MDRGIYRMGIIAGIPLKVHWSFGLLISFIVFLIYSKGLTPNEAFWFILMIVGLFVSVILHELGHAMAAKYYGIKTQDIIISPIGGIARLEFLPIKPIQEFVVALSGPTVNIIIALIIFLSKYSYFIERNIVPNDYDLFNGLTGWIHFLFSMNLALFAFNLIPAFPMDGGRIIRALLAMKMEKYSATVLAARIGQVLAVGFVIIGIFNLNPILAFIGVFVFSMAQREVSIAGQDLKLEAISAGGFYKADFTKIYIDETLERAIELNQNTNEKSFLVFDRNEEIVGSLHALFLAEAKTSNHQKVMVKDYLSPKKKRIAPEVSLKAVWNIMNEEGLSLVAVIDNNDQLLGVIKRSDITRYLDS